ncbi:hypothetical protein [Brevundimonas sp.]|uniref:hypothetical protein n=1 Tax=Brevundimonas sp. TaxID=1871086 RepID=UPI002D3FBD5B|nr:hypothetical protein [Brevundimonas sp.]HYD27161.1 hypothetical protein [Brevundimonas sp.]
MRGAAILALGAALLAGCDRIHAPAEGGEPTRAAACDPDSEDCRGEAGRIATAAAFTEEDFGIVATFPAGAGVCPVFSGDAVRGYFTRVGLERFDCLGQHVEAAGSSYGVRASWNPAFEPTLDAVRGADRSCRQDDRFNRGADGRPFAIRGLESRACVSREPDGRILIDVEAAAGRWDGVGQEEADTPKAIYTAWLLTSEESWTRDRALFGAFLDWLIAAPEDNADCFWQRGRLTATNGSPGVRIFLATGRVLGVTSPSGDEGPDVLPAEAMAALKSRGDAFSTNVSGDWLVCALAPDRPGQMRPVRVIDARDMRATER